MKCIRWTSRTINSINPLLLASLSLALLLTACSNVATERPGSDAASAPAGASQPQVMAVVGGEEISRSEVEEAVAADLLKLEQQQHQALEEGLEQAVSRKVLEIEAASRDLAVEELVQQEVEEQIEAPTDAQVDAFYEERKAQIQQPKEEVADQIRDFLQQQGMQEKFGQLISDLRAKYEVRTFLEPFRVAVEAAGSPAKGPEDAEVTIVAFSDFQCPFCSRVNPTLDKVLETYGDSVRLVFRQFPLGIHPQARKASEAALCAHEQGKFWEMHDALFADQRNLAVPALKEKAASLGLDAGVFDACLDEGKFEAKVEEDFEAGRRAGVSGTPAMFINGRFLSGAQPYEEFAKIIDDELGRSGAG
jgi:protein-disulfide isomerase